MKRNSFIILLATVVILGGVIGGALVGGMAIGKDQGREEASQLASRLGQTSIQQVTPQQGTSQQDLPFAGGFGGLFGRGGAVGTVEKVEGNIVTLNTTEGAVRVLITYDTSIQKMGEGSLDDISPGENISVSGERQEDDSIEATNIFIGTTMPRFGAQ